MKRFPLAAALSVAFAGAGLATGMPAQAHTPAATASAHDTVEMDQLLGQEQRVDNFYRAYFPDLDTGHKAAITFHEQLLESNWKGGYLVLQLGDDDIAKLKAFKFRVEKDEAFIAKHHAMVQRLRAAGSPNILGGSGAQLAARAAESGESIPSYPCYETVEETFAAAEGFTTTYPQLASWKAVGQSWEKSQGTGGYDMFVLKLTNKDTTGPNGEAKPKLFINAGMHAREYATAPLVLAFAKQLLTGYGTDADATWILDHHEIHMMLQTNPDGRKKAEGGLMWRKNTNRNYCGANSNSRGADLNRNFSFTWNITKGQGSSGNACSETYRGPSAASEPETQSVEDYARSLWPDRRGPNQNDPAPADTSGMHLDVHSYSELVLWPWGHVKQAAPNGTAMQTLGRKLAYFNGYTPEQSIGLYPTDGTSDDIPYGELGVPAMTFEIGTSFFQSCSSFESNIKPKNLPALMYAAKVLRTPYLTPAGPDVTKLKLSASGVTAGTPVTLTATVTDTRFNNSKGAEPTQNIAAVEAYIDVPPWMPGSQAVALSAKDGAFDAKTEVASTSLSTSGLKKGKHLVFVRGKDAEGNLGAFSAVFLKIK
ncbi:M14 family metallopeptidase [Ideonella sp. DXS29W]|uniref:M14 family metallopeptidase n=1 Tax=Ideonella lacteola TaxID=2984193 RepID=A0ABU9BQC3_9BURK